MKTKLTTKDLLECISVLSIIALLLFVAHNAKAGDLMLGHVTYHFHDYANEKYCANGTEACLSFNDKQKLIGYAGEKYAIVYIPENSVKRESFIATRLYRYELNNNLRPYAAIGISTGYYRIYQDISYEKITPVGYFGVDIHPKSDKFGLMINWSPDGFIGAGLRIKIR